MWIREQLGIINGLLGRVVIGYSAVEMAFRENPIEGVDPFRDPSLPFRQLERLFLSMKTGEIASFGTYQNDTVFGISLSYERRPADYDASIGAGDFFRAINIDDLPCGRISSIEPVLSEVGDIASITIGVQGDKFLLFAGEVYERSDGGLDVLSDDECILLFRNPSLRDQVRIL